MVEWPPVPGDLSLTCDMGGCQNYGPFLGTLNIRCRIILGIQKGTIILTNAHVFMARLQATSLNATALEML